VWQKTLRKRWRSFWQTEGSRPVPYTKTLHLYDAAVRLSKKCGVQGDHPPARARGSASQPCAAAHRSKHSEHQRCKMCDFDWQIQVSLTERPPHDELMSCGGKAVKSEGCRGIFPQPQSSYSPLPWAALVSVDDCGSLTPSALCPLGTRFPPSPLPGVGRAHKPTRRSVFTQAQRAPQVQDVRL